MFNTKKVPKFSIILISIALIMFVFISINYISNHLFSNIDSDERIEYCQRIKMDKVKFIHDDATCNIPNNSNVCQYSCPGWHSYKSIIDLMMKWNIIFPALILLLHLRIL